MCMHLIENESDHAYKCLKNIEEDKWSWFGLTIILKCDLIVKNVSESLTNTKGKKEKK